MQPAGVAVTFSSSTDTAAASASARTRTIQEHPDEPYPSMPPVASPSISLNMRSARHRLIGPRFRVLLRGPRGTKRWTCLLYTSDAADDLLCVDLGGRRI